MEKCTSCDRHLIGQEKACPFCGASLGGGFTQLRNTVAAGVTMMVLAACYGPPPGDKVDSSLDSGVDADGDGFFLGEDCDDADAAVNPGVAEVCDDGVDNDCDELTDGDDDECAAK